MSDMRHCAGCPGYQDADHAWDTCPGLPPDPELARLREAARPALRLLDSLSAYQRHPDRGNPDVECAMCMGELIGPDETATIEVLRQALAAVEQKA